MSNSENPEKKIIVDEDWKSQAQAEKEELAKKQAEAKTETADSASQSDQAADSTAGLKWPEPSLQVVGNHLGYPGAGCHGPGSASHLGKVRTRRRAGEAFHRYGGNAHAKNRRQPHQGRIRNDRRGSSSTADGIRRRSKIIRLALRQFLQADVAELHLHGRARMDLEGQNAFETPPLVVVVGHVGHHTAVDLVYEVVSAGDNSVAFPLALFNTIEQFFGRSKRPDNFGFVVRPDNDLLATSCKNAASALFVQNAGIR